MNSKEDVKHEKMLREMSHRAGNKQCMTCVGHGGRAPQYVCVAFGTFVCTACAGVHRDFQFRVKSISSSKFSKEEVQLANEVGNDAARASFLAGWYGTENERSCPMVENTKTAPLKNFIRQVFVERRFEGQRAAPAQQAPAQQTPQAPVVQQPSFGNFGVAPPGQQFQRPQQPQPPAAATPAPAARFVDSDARPASPFLAIGEPGVTVVGPRPGARPWRAPRRK